VPFRYVSVAASSIAILLGAVSCGRDDSASPSSGSGAASATVVVYCSADKEFAEPIFRAYEARSGVKVLPLYDTEETKTAGLTARLAAEKDQPRADVFWSSDTSRAVALVDQGLTAPYVPKTSESIPDQYKSRDGAWTGFGARIRVLLYNTEHVKADEAPRSVLDLTQPRWKGRVAIANPHFGTTSFHLAALFVKWGDEKAVDFMRQLKNNGVVIAAGNADVRDRVADGRVYVGIMDEDDAVVALRDKKPVAIAILDQEGSNGLGTPLMPNVALLVRGAPHVDQAQRFIDFLVSADAEKMLAESDAAQYPLHPGVPGPTLLPPLPQIRAMEVDYREVARRLPSMDAAVRNVFGL
jgi:iron(III) transport system substrate-binding protein